MRLNSATAYINLILLDGVYISYSLVPSVLYLVILLIIGLDHPIID